MIKVETNIKQSQEIQKRLRDEFYASNKRVIVNFFNPGVKTINHIYKARENG